MPEMTTRTLEQRLVEIRERHAATTKGPWRPSRWHSDSCPPDCDDQSCFVLVTSPSGLVGDTDTEPGDVFYAERDPATTGTADVEFIAHAHQDIPILLAALDAALSTGLVLDADNAVGLDEPTRAAMCEGAALHMAQVRQAVAEALERAGDDHA